jgi:anaerobic selenocysteine-containing dehydrogenase/Fe-S-cluster-containing dehydrogenase component
LSQLALMIDLERCIGCKSCEAACKAEHGLGPTENRNRVVWLAHHDSAGLDFLTLSCQHCHRPACVRACPVSPKAITKDPDTGVVAIAESLCTGCGECVVACPYGAMGYDRIDHHAVKCDLCSQRRDDGLRPACATVCPGEAISFGERDAHLSAMAAAGRRAVDHDAFLLGPSNIFLERQHASPEMLGSGESINLFDFTIADRQRPAVVDDVQQKLVLSPDDVAYPYRRPAEARKADRIVPGGCNICFNCCPVNYHIKDDKLVRVTGNEDDPLWRGKICPKSQFLLQLHNSPERLTTPLKRVGKRGDGVFEPISWDQALDEIAAKLNLTRENYGPESLAIFAGTRTGTLTRRGYIRLFTQMWGTPNYGDTEAFCSEAKRVSYQATLGAGGSGNSYTEADIGSAALYVYFGDNQAETRPVHFGMVNNWRLKNNAKMVVIDPRMTVTATKANQWLAIRPGTDLALALALAFHILKDNLHDQKFCENWVAGWDNWRDFLFEKNYSPDWAADIVGIDAAAIRALAEDIAAADGCVLFASRGVNQHSNGGQTNRALMFVAAITGNIGRKGGAYFNLSTPVPIAANAPEDRKTYPSKPMIGSNSVTWLDAIEHHDPYPLKAVITSNNPMMAWPNQARVRAAFKKLDLLVHIDLFRNETSDYADYILPAATGIEKGEISRAAEDRRIVWIDKAVPPPGDAKPDDWFWIELGKRFGFEDVLKDSYKDPAVFWDEMLINDPYMRGCTQDRLHATKSRWLRVPLPDPAAKEIDTLYLEGSTALGKPDGHRFPTASGKLEFWTPKLEQIFSSLGLSALPEFYADCEHLIDIPYVERQQVNAATVERPFIHGTALVTPFQIVQPHAASPARNLQQQGFDTHLITGRPPAPHFHSWTHYAWQAQEMWPDMYVQMHPDKAAELGIRDGQEATVETAHGKVTARAWLYAGMRRDTVFVPIGWDASQPYHPWNSVNYLTDEAQRDPLSDHSNLKSYLCRVSA